MLLKTNHLLNTNVEILLVPSQNTVIIFSNKLYKYPIFLIPNLVAEVELYLLKELSVQQSEQQIKRIYLYSYVQLCNSFQVLKTLFF